MLEDNNLKVPFDVDKEQSFSLIHLLSLKINSEYQNAHLTFPKGIHSTAKIIIESPDYKDPSTLILDIEKLFDLPINKNLVFPIDFDLIIIINKNEIVQRIDKYKFIIKDKKDKEISDKVALLEIIDDMKENNEERFSKILEMAEIQKKILIKEIQDLKTRVLSLYLKDFPEIQNLMNSEETYKKSYQKLKLLIEDFNKQLGKIAGI